jgi:hypothetical protein
VPERRDFGRRQGRVRYALAGQGRSSRGRGLVRPALARLRRERVSPAPASKESADPRERFAGLISRRRMQHSPPSTAGASRKWRPGRSSMGTLHPRQSPGEEPSPPRPYGRIRGHSAGQLHSLSLRLLLLWDRERQRAAPGTGRSLLGGESLRLGRFSVRTFPCPPVLPQRDAVAAGD